jgi:DNA-binding NarL/FixJ family response regulator
VLTTFDDDDYLFGAFREGADGFLFKTASAEELKAATARVSKGERFVALVTEQGLGDLDDACRSALAALTMPRPMCCGQLNYTTAAVRN